MAVYLETNLPKLSAAEARGIDVTKPFECSVCVDQQLAFDWLEKYNLKNRPLNATKLRHYVHLAVTDQLVHHHPAPIVFSTLANLDDGQHRLRTVFESGVQWWLRVIFGAPPEAREHIDTGLTRALKDRIVLIPESEGENSTACQMVRELAVLHLRHKGVLAPDFARGVFAKFEKGLRFAAKVRSRADRGVGRVGVWAAIAEASYVDEDKTREFAEDLKHIDGKIQPARYLRDALIRNGSATGGTSCERIYGQTVYAVTAHFRGKTISHLRTMARWGEEYLLVIPQLTVRPDRTTPDEKPEAK